MNRATLGQLEQAAKDLSDVTGEQYVWRPVGSGFFDFGRKDGENYVQIVNRKLKDLIEFLDAYRRGYGASLDRRKQDAPLLKKVVGRFIELAEEEDEETGGHWTGGIQTTLQEVRDVHSRL